MSAAVEPTSTRPTDFCRASCIDVGELRADAKRGFERAAIELRYLDTAVIRCLIADKAQVVETPLGYCLAVGRRLQEEATDSADERRRAFEREVSASCPHGSVVDHCSECARDREFALELFPSLRRYVRLTPSPTARRGFGVIVAHGPRAGQRSWFEEFDELAAEGFVWRSDQRTEAGARVCFCCGEDMEVRLFERRDVSYRAYALCVMCGWWFEL